jgi:hypothetical protein
MHQNLKINFFKIHKTCYDSPIIAGFFLPYKWLSFATFTL